MSCPETPPLRTKPPGANAKCLSVRLTEEERRLLAERAGRQPLAAYLRDLALAKAAHGRRRSSMAPIKDHEALARVLAALGQSRFANNLNQLAKAANIGALPVTREIDSDIRDACAAVAIMRRDLMRALGLADGGRT